VFSATSAMTPMHPEMTVAFGCAPLIPPRPEETNTFPARSSVPRYFLPAFSTVICKTGVMKDHKIQNQKRGCRSCLVGNVPNLRVGDLRRLLNATGSEGHNKPGNACVT